MNLNDFFLEILATIIGIIILFFAIYVIAVIYIRRKAHIIAESLPISSDTVHHNVSVSVKGAGTTKSK